MGDRVRSISTEQGAPGPIVGTVISVEGKTVVRKDGVEHFPYLVHYDEGQHLMMDILFGWTGCPENDDTIESADERE